MTKAKKDARKTELEDELEEALEATFPASDPVQIGSPTSETPDRPIDRRPAALDKALVDKLACEVGRKKGAA
jgi:hypothetical protein